MFRTPLFPFLLLLLTACRTDEKPGDTASLDGEDCTWHVDADGDGYGDPEATALGSCEGPEAGLVENAEDCDDADVAINPAASEICDGLDNDCDGSVDEDAQDPGTWYADGDGDGYGDPDSAQQACEPDSGWVEDASDCDDGDAEIHPDAAERCDGLDNDCDDQIDEDLQEIWYADADGDGYGDADVTVDSCDPGTGWSAVAGDCDDGDATIHPDAQETCDGLDNDCDGETDEDLQQTFWADADGDGYGDPHNASLACQAEAGMTDNEQDCDDSNSAIHPAAQEACNGYDDDCDGLVDDEDGDLADAATWYADADGDGYGLDDSTVTACSQPSGYAAYGGDCDDGDASYNPGAAEEDCTDPADYNCDGSTGYEDADGDGWAACEDCDDGDASISPDGAEACNGVDDDCDGDIDEDDASDASTWYADADGDGYGDASSTAVACDQPSGHVAALYATDCDDGDAAVHPAAAETCNDVDDDCDGNTDEGVTSAFYADADGDGYGDTSSTAEACQAPSGYVEDDTDCDDGQASVHPGANEVCDGLDNDCDGTADGADATDASTWYADRDADGFGDAAASTLSCDQPSGYVQDDTDCDDYDDDINPDADELCDGDDNDCDGDTDEDDATDAGTWYADTDADGYGDDASAATACSPPTGYVAEGGDCDDSDAAVNPGATELCNGYDDDCDGLTDDEDGDVTGTSSWYADADGDGFGNAAYSRTACDQPSGYVTDSSDCDDGDASSYPGGSELCDGADNDCDGDIDEDDAADASTWYADADADGYGDEATASTACSAPTGYVAEGGDCDDSDASANPAAEESCDGVDNDCDGSVDEEATDAATWYADADADSYGDAAQSATACSQPSGHVADSSDCDDGDAAVNPVASETCDGVDNDCDGQTDEDDATDASTWYADGDGDGYGDAAQSTAACSQPSDHVANSSDCDDDNNTISPAAEERCDGVDNDCDGDVDEDDATDAGSWYADTDADGYGDEASTATACDRPTGHTAAGGDCDDGDAAINPGAAESCNGADDDCDGDTDEDVLTTWYADADGDGYGDAASSSEACTAPSGYGADASDCDDGDAAINPGATEACNGYDDDCDGVDDEGYSDADGDGTADCVDDCPVYADPAASSGGDGSFSSPYASINEAINNRGSACDEILLMPGTYDETVDYAGQDLYIHSESGAEVTIIEPSAGGTVVTFESYETSDAILEGVTLRGGTGVLGDGVYLDASYTHGGGIFVYNADPTIIDCIVEDNTVTGYGGGGLFYEYHGLFSGNQVRDNASTDISDGGGGGLNLRYSDAEVLQNQITGNDTYGSSGDGGGVMIADGAPLVGWNWIEDNYATSSGGGIRSASAQPTIVNNVVVGNIPDGVTLSYDDAGYVINNTIADNSRYGLYSFTCCSYTGTTGPTTEVINNLIIDSGTYGLVVSGYTSFTSFAYNDVYGSGSADYSGYTDPTGSDGNISADPLFVGDPDWSLQAGSPAVDAGTDASAYGVDDDYEGTARPAGSGWDMGAYESY